MTFSAILRSAKSTIRLGFIPTTSIRPRRRLMRAAEARADLPEVRPEDLPAAGRGKRAGRAFRLISAGLIFLISRIVPDGADALAAAADSAISFQAFSAADAVAQRLRPRQKRVR